jgi:hypothetical protein
MFRRSDDVEMTPIGIEISTIELRWKELNQVSSPLLEEGKEFIKYPRRTYSGRSTFEDMPIKMKSSRPSTRT